MVTKLKRVCPSFSKELFYSCVSALNLATRKNSKCSSCSKLGRPSSNKGAPFQSLYNHSVYISKHRGIVNSLSFSDFLEFTKIENCHYCGCPVTWREHRRHTKDYSGYNLDRKDNNEGYMKDNCVVCCEVCNYMKRMMSVEYFIQHCHRVVSHQKRINVT